MRPGARLALLSVLLSGMASAQTPDPPASLVVGRWLGESNVGGVPCQPNMVCTNVISDVRLGEVRTLAGPRVGKWVIANFEYHAPIVDAAELVLLVWPLAGGSNRFEGQWVGAVWRAPRFAFRPTCFRPTRSRRPRGPFSERPESVSRTGRSRIS